MFKNYDIIVVGAGHAGCEAAAAAANLGSSVLLITMNMGTIGQMSCNPAMGGVAKGQLVREIDALGGFSGIVTDKTAIQFRMLNTSKGPAMWSPRAQSDRWRFAEEWRLQLESLNNLDFWQESVTGLLIEDKNIVGVKTSMGHEIKCKAVVLTNGTFLNGIIHIGEKQIGGGRAAEKASIGITEQLNEMGFRSGRMKTGTPPRVDGRSLDYDKMEEQFGDDVPQKFSFTNTKHVLKQKSCYITYTNPNVHEILKTGFEQSPMFAGRIKGVGPRYCPSIEDKIERFAERDRHIIFVEPEGWNTVEVYINGFSTSLPAEVQNKAMKKIPGFANSKMFRPGYAIEYDYFPPEQLKNTLETKSYSHLFFAGQINGTTGYEEAASQGLIAGINAHLKINELDPFVLGRNEAYIGVLIDDLINKGTDEPYRMFTSRAEFRMHLRQDNADIRLTPKACAIGMLPNSRLKQINEKEASVKELIMKTKSYLPDNQDVNEYFEYLGSNPVTEPVSLHRILSRPEVKMDTLAKLNESTRQLLSAYSDDILQQASIHIKYHTYIAKEMELANKLNGLEHLHIVDTVDYQLIGSLSTEGREKLSTIRPQTLGQASRISGVSPSDISILLVYLNSKKKLAKT